MRTSLLFLPLALAFAFPFGGILNIMYTHNTYRYIIKLLVLLNCITSYVIKL